MGIISVQLYLRGVDCGTMIVSGIQDGISVENLVSESLDISSYTTASEKINPVVALHMVSNGAVCFKLSPLSDIKTDWLRVGFVHRSLSSELKV